MNNSLNLNIGCLSWASNGLIGQQGRNLALEPTIQIYRQIFLMLHNTEEPRHFEEAKRLLTTHGHRFEAHELKQLYTLLLNYCTRRINRFNDEIFWHEYLEINKLLLENGLIFENGYLPPWRYTNLVTVGLRTGQTDWTHGFIHRYRGKLLPAYSENLFRYNLAQFHFHQQDFDNAQRELVHVEFTDVLLNLGVRSLLIKIYFETGQDEILYSYLEATRIFCFATNFLDKRVKQQMKKFVEYCGKLLKAQRWRNCNSAAAECCTVTGWEAGSRKEFDIRRAARIVLKPGLSTSGAARILRIAGLNMKACVFRLRQVIFQCLILETQVFSKNCLLNFRLQSKLPSSTFDPYQKI
ncbi:MAG: hypothetical protein IPM82_03490 [Saprospiraceae bacterium]|nr:hypothetical protein [Saprospiraceae bacterium]